MKKLLLTIASIAMLTQLDAQIILQDNFTYSDGITTNVSGGLWKYSSGSDDSYIKNGRLEVSGVAPAVRSGDIFRLFTGTPGNIVYASFIVNMTNFPSSVGAYFAHFKDGGNNFRGRVWALTNATPRTWRLAIGNGGNPTAGAVVPLDLATNVDYKVVITWDNTTGGSQTAKIWIDPTDETDFNATGGDTASTTPITLASFAFRQAAGEGNMQIDDLYVGNSFADVNVGAVKPATVYYNPPAGPTTVFTGNNATLACVGGGAGTVTFQWQHAGTNLVDDANYVGATSNVLALVSAVTTQTGNYQCIVTSTTNSVFSSSATSAVAQVTVSAAPVPPSFTSQPVSQTVYSGQSVVFSTTVNSPGNVSYQWKSNNVDLVGETGPTLTLNNVTTAYSGSQYRVGVTNDVVANGILSTNATLTVIDPPSVSIAFLRSLVDPVTFQSTASLTQPYKVTGTVTTYTNITTANTSSYYLQDGTAGINIFATFGSTFRPAQGDIVTFVGVVSSFSSGLELYADTVGRPYTSYSIVSSGNPLPTPVAIPFTLTNTYSYAYIATNLAGRLVKLSNVYFGTNSGAAIAGGTITVTNSSGDPFYLSFFAVDQDTTGQILPEFASSVTGVLYGNHPNYSLAVTKFSDIVTTAPVVPIPLGFSSSGGNLTFTWGDASFSLQNSTNVVGPYTTIDGATTGFTTNMLYQQMYFRLTHP